MMRSNLKNILLLVLALMVLTACATSLDHTLTAKGYYEKGQYDQAIASGKRATKLDPNYAPGWYWLGTAYYKKKQWDEAIQAYEKVLQLNPNRAQLQDSYAKLAYLYPVTEQYDKAIQVTKRALELNPEDKGGTLHANLGFAYYHKGKYDQAIAAFKRSIELDPGDKSTQQWLMRAYLNKHLVPARKAKEEGNYAAAVTAYRRAILFNPKNPTPYQQSGHLLLTLCDPDGAISLFEEAIKLSPNDEWTQNLRRDIGHAYRFKGDAANVRRFLGGLGFIGMRMENQSREVVVVSVSPNLPAAKAGLQPGDRTLQVAGGSVKNYNEVISRIAQVEPGSQLTLQIRRGEQVLDKTITVGSVLDLLPEKPNSSACRAQELNREGVALAREGKNVTALAKFGEALQTAPGPLPKANYNAALTLERLGRPGEALRHYIKAQESFLLPEDEIGALTQLVALTRQARISVPETADRRYRVGILRTKQKRYKEAIQDFEQAIAEAPWIVAAYNNLGRVYDFNKEYSKALRVLRIYTKLAPNAANIGSIKTKMVELEDRLGLLDEPATGKAARGWLGVSIQPITVELKNTLGLPSTEGALVSDIVEGGSAERAGLKIGDVIIEYIGNTVQDAAHLENLVSHTTPGETVTINAIREGRVIVFEVILGAEPTTEL